MAVRRGFWCIMALGAIAALAGCGGTTTDKASPATAADATQGDIRRRSADDLPAVSEYLPPLDDGKVEVAGPEGWIQLPNTSNHLVAFAPAKDKAYPRINVTAADSPLPVLGDLTEENLDQFATVFDEPYKKKQSVLPEPARPIVLGGTPYIRQVRRVLIGKKKLVLQWLATVRSGRMYTVELFCEVDPANPEEYAKALKEARDHAYAVAAHLAPVAAASESPANTTEAVPPVEKSAEPADKPAVPPPARPE
ncbi:MAG: hypothetical protein L0211_23875 [Planctomycetaceae bacterium]|nr:hypothetical protein [Planctomycetaceae bacterium]